MKIMKKTKIICSIGPASNNYKTLKEMIKNGMNIARINFSHAKYKDIEKCIDIINDIDKKLNTITGIMYDTKGPDFRGYIDKEYIKLEKNSKVLLAKDNVIDTNKIINVNDDKLIDSLKINDTVFLSDGLIKLKVIEKNNSYALCKVLEEGIFYNEKGINVPNLDIKREFLSKTDIENITYACNHGCNFLALSFVSCKEDIKKVRDLLNDLNHKEILIVSKIETKKAYQNIDEIISNSDAIMVARGDLGIEIDCVKIPLIQKEIIKKCKEKQKPCIVATEMLLSMCKSPRPTRAETQDVANAVLDGTDAVMLSEESAVGNYPSKAVKFMADICENTEKILKSETNHVKPNITNAIASASIDTVNMLKAKLIVSLTTSGYTPYQISNLKPVCPVLALCKNKQTAKKLTMKYGVYPVYTQEYKNIDEYIKDAISKAKEFTKLKKKDIIIITCSKSQNINANMMKIEEI